MDCHCKGNTPHTVPLHLPRLSAHRNDPVSSIPVHPYPSSNFNFGPDRPSPSSSETSETLQYPPIPLDTSRLSGTLRNLPEPPGTPQDPPRRMFSYLFPYSISFHVIPFPSVMFPCHFFCTLYVALLYIIPYLQADPHPFLFGSPAGMFTCIRLLDLIQLWIPCSLCDLFRFPSRPGPVSPPRSPLQ